MKHFTSLLHLQSRVSFAIGDAEKLDEPDDAYDLVINRHLLWTLPHPNEAVTDWIRVTKPGGSVIVIDGDWSMGRKQQEEKNFLRMRKRSTEAILRRLKKVFLFTQETRSL